MIITNQKATLRNITINDKHNFGPPGTGKTWTLLDKLEEYIKQSSVDINKIGFFTFFPKMPPKSS